MSMVLKVCAVLLVIGGVWIWAHGRSVTKQVVLDTETSLPASAILAVEQGAFDREGTIIVDMTQGQSGLPFILYTEYNAQGKPAIKTKRLVFEHLDACAEANLPCVSNQPGIPVEPNDKVRVVGIVRNEQVIVQEIYRL